MNTILSLEQVSVSYPVKSGLFSHSPNVVKAVDGVSFDIAARETLALVGESGCGKSTLARAIIQLEPLSGGRILFEDAALSPRPHHPRMQIIFQDPASSLNPRKSVESMLREVLVVHRVVPREAISAEIDRLLSLVGLDGAARPRFPHEFSGGERQRLCIARALAPRPSLLICDEATSSLDAFTQARILALFRQLQDTLGLTYLFISHGLGAVRNISDRVAVMYQGKIVECAPTAAIFSAPRHPYTQALLSAIPAPDPRLRGLPRRLLSAVSDTAPAKVSDTTAAKVSDTAAATSAGRAMRRYVIRRVLLMLPILLGVSIVNFALIHLAPGSPLDLMISPTMTPETRAALERNLGLDAPPVRQYFAWLANILRGNWGYSYSAYRPVTTLIAERLPATVLLMGSALLIGLIIAMPLGMVSAVKRRSLFDYCATFFAFMGVSTPNFFLGLGLMYVFSVKLKLFPSSGSYSLGVNGGALDTLRHLALPCAVLSVHITGRFIRYVRSAMLAVLKEEYLQTAKAKGAPLIRRVVVHAFRNALLPLISFVGLELPGLFGGAIVTEQIFSWPGIGRLTVDSILSRDYPVLMGLTLLTALVTLLSSLITDLLYTAADPRISFNSSQK